MDYILRYELWPEDIDFLNETSIDWYMYKHDVLSDNDSGWCDYSTGGYVVTAQDRVIFKDVSQSDLTFLTLKYGYRLKQLTSDMQGIYNEAQAHNVGPLTVLDSETVV